MKGKLLFLGCGSSTGVPMIGCRCSTCTSTDPRNQRLRPSVLLEIEGKKLLIDAGPDFRTQALRYGITHLDGVFFTHTHFDHIAGIDELRVYYLDKKHPLPALSSEVTHEVLQQRYPYLFRKKSKETSLPAQLDFQLLEKKRGKTTFLTIPIGYFSYEQGGMEVTGFRFGNLAYVSDISKYEESIFEDVKGVNTLIISALKQEPSLMHLSIAQAIDFRARVGAKKTYLMHLGHEVEYVKTSQALPEGVYVAYDGLTMDFEI